MREKLAAKDTFELPGEFGKVNLEEDDNIVAVCTAEGCKKVIFIGNSNNPIQFRVLISRIRDHIDFYASEDGENEHEIDIIYPRSGKNGRIIDSSDLNPLCLPIDPKAS